METSKVINVVKKDSDLLSVLASKFDGMQTPVSNSGSGTNKMLYKFERSNLGSKEQRKLRNKARKDLQKFADDLHTAVHMKNENKVKEIVKNFVAYYKQTYLINDFSFGSVRSTITNSTDKKRIEILLQIAKELQG